METWKRIEEVGRCGIDYYVSSLGRIKKVMMIRCGEWFMPKEIILLGSTNKRYPKVVFGKNGKRFYIHRLVAEYFLSVPRHVMDTPLNDLVVDHINGKTADNRIDNLRWCTTSENNKFSWIRKKLREARNEHNKQFSCTREGKDQEK